MKKETSDKDVANAWTAFILGQLFESWPRRQDFNAMDVGVATSFAPRSDPEELFDDLLMWLDRNHYIHIDQHGSEGNAYGVSLTNEGLKVLGQQPQSLDRPLGTRMKEAAASIGGEVRGATIAELIGTLVGAAAKQFSQP
ncbi:hypothetical protein NOJ28_11400 [Neorhizobium galegae]|uniref:hypothetical protein n=1 Tax=Neorhizobium galegae TaxID=399 RepID=UPI002107ECC5|nr:hypothetical protein [Neorhizobium galegae]MCQ1766141.1 hypothetical protein [Neorhizobium galegae]MCQ1845055.1 hypothetical protein [Neorhizobium galegae]